MSKTIAVFTSHADHINTGGKNVWLGKWLKAAGYQVLMVCWDEANADAFKQHKLPYLMAQIDTTSTDLHPQAQALEQLLTLPAIEGTRVKAPSLGSLLAWDDFLGCAKQWKTDGLDALTIDAYVTTLAAQEMPIAEDVELGLALWRYMRAHTVPQLAIECSPIHNDLRLTQWPVDMLLTKNDPRDETGMTAPRYTAIAKEVYRMPRSHRYVLSLSHEPALEQFYQDHEASLRKQLRGSRYLFLPFHLSYKERCIEMLEHLKRHPFLIRELLAADFSLVISCDSRQTRRTLTEQDMIVGGLTPWLEPWQSNGQPRFFVIDGPPQLWLMDMAQAILAPCETIGTEWARRWEIPVITPGQEDHLTDLSLGTSVVEALQWMLPQ